MSRPPTSSKANSPEIITRRSKEEYEALASRYEPGGDLYDAGWASNEVAIKFGLLACPFCGSDHLSLELCDDPFWEVFCEHCWAKGPARPNQEAAITAWNRRAIAGS
jgi:Lar family restriction alleviation protein